MNYFKGTAFTANDYGSVTILEDYLFQINLDGQIERLYAPNDTSYQQTLAKARQTNQLYEATATEYFFPGFVDLHVHAPQWGQAGTALDLPLYEWLNNYTFPLESKFSNLEFAEEVYQDLVPHLLANGTTTALYFASVHLEASYRLAEICAEKGQRGLVGKVVMDDQNENPEYYRDQTTEQALADTETFILKVKELHKKTKQGVYPVVTPRFIPSCTDEGLAGLGELAKKHDVHVQSHCSESDWAHQTVHDRYGKNDAFALNDFGLLGEKSVMAHSNFLTDDDADLFATTGTAIAHCPVSNAYFGNSVLPVQHLKTKNLEIGLGSDISGGFSPSLFQNIRQAVISSRMLEDGVNPDLSAEQRGRKHSQLTVNQAFYLATAGGGESLSLPIGRFKPGYAWDLQIIDIKPKQNQIPLFGIDSLEEIFQKIIYLATPENITSVWVQGTEVYNQKGDSHGK